MTDNENIEKLRDFEMRIKSTNLFNYIRLYELNAVIDALDLINRQKAEIERLQKLQKPTETSGFKVENGK